MSRRKITEDIHLLWQRHDNAEATIEKLQEWTTDRRDYFLSKLDWLQDSLNKGNHEAYRIAYNQLKMAIQQQKDTLDKVHDMLLFEDDK